MRATTGRYLRVGLVSLIFILCSCSDDTSQTDPLAAQSNQPTVDPLTTNNILEALYLNRRIPEGFYSEPEPEPSILQVISHTKNIDIMNPATISPSTPVYELCADNFTQAFNWSETSNSYGATLVDNSEDNLFYQFKRVNLSNPDTQYIQRVYKCGTLSRDSIDIQNPSTHLGIYTETPQNPSTVKKILEYFWTFSLKNNYGYAVLSSESIEDSTIIKHVFHEARLTPAAQLSSACDLIEVYKIDHLIDTSNGEIRYSEQAIMTLNARYDNNIELCTG